MNLPTLDPLIIVGLGNPGDCYKNTRHNMGFLVVEAFASSVNQVMKKENQFQASIGKKIIKGRIVHCLLPLTYMNLSGIAVKKYLDYFKLPVAQVVVVTDDIALNYGQLRLKTQGSAGGHNGLKSIENHLQTTYYTRLRMGIGHPGQQVMSDYVLEAYTPLQLETLPEFIDCGVKVLQRLLVESPSYTMKAVNTGPQRPLLKEKPVESKDLTKPPNLGVGEHA